MRTRLKATKPFIGLILFFGLFCPGFLTANEAVHDLAIKSRATASWKLAQERASQGNVSDLIENMDKMLASRTPAFTRVDIGATDKKVREILNLGWKSEATAWWKVAQERAAKQSVFEYIEHMDKALASAVPPLTRANIGVTDEKVWDILAKGNINTNTKK